MVRRVYLAGPEVFLRDPIVVTGAKKKICHRDGFEGVSPLDTELDLSTLPAKEAGWQISQANENLLRECDLLIANMTPFRGPSMDVGTAFEVGFMRALGRLVLGYTNIDGTLLERTRAQFSGDLRHREGSGDLVEDPDGLQVEDFGLVDNLMIDGAILSSGAEVVVMSASQQELFTDVRGFELCVREAARILG